MSNYRAGADLERAAKASLEQDGYYVIRSAGSKGVVDLAAFKPGEVLFVQCKVDGYLAPDERIMFQHRADLCGATPLVARWQKEGSKARIVAFKRLWKLTGPEDWTADHEPEFRPVRAARMTVTDPRESLARSAELLRRINDKS